VPTNTCSQDVRDAERVVVHIRLVWKITWKIPRATNAACSKSLLPGTLIEVSVGFALGLIKIRIFDSNVSFWRNVATRRPRLRQSGKPVAGGN